MALLSNLVFLEKKIGRGAATFCHYFCNNIITLSLTCTSTRSSSSSSSHPDNSIPISRTLLPRYAGPSDDELTDEQRRIRHDIVQSRHRTGLNGPFGPWLAIPPIAQHAQELGKVCRYGTSLSMAESELIILLTGAKMKSKTEFDIHTKEALASGLCIDIIEAIPRDDNNFSIESVHNNVLPLLKRKRNASEYAREKVIVQFTTELLCNCTVSDETYNTTKEVLGGEDVVLVEITTIIGYYTLVSLTLNVFQIPSHVTK